MPDIDYSTLGQIRIKVRRLTRSPSVSQLTNNQIDNYINTFVLYDFPEITVDSRLTFYTYPNRDTYSSNFVNNTDPLYNFKNEYLGIKPPVYLAGNEISFSQSREEFFRTFPKKEISEDIGVGDGVNDTFFGNLQNFPIIPNETTFSSVEAFNMPIILKDKTVNAPVTGISRDLGQIIDPDSNNDQGDITYTTGQYFITFLNPPALGATVRATYYPYQADKPIAVLFEDNVFTFRPVPDKTYRVDIDAYKRPSELIANNQMPDLTQWWQYIAYGAAKKVFEDRMDMESIEAIMPEFMRQRSLVIQKLTIQQSTERVSTIYVGSGFNFNNTLS
jgi:hypothetical protein